VHAACGDVELLVGIPALNQARSVAHVVERVLGGMTKRSAAGPAALVVVDAGSVDGTPEAVPRAADAGIRPAVVGLQAATRGQAILEILAGAQRAGARACAVVDAGLESVSPEGLERLLAPVVTGEADYVSPTYSHPVSDGTLSTNLLAPLARALFGVRLQQIVGSCLALSPALLARLVAAPEAEAVHSQKAAEVWLPLEALAGGLRVVEAAQGRKVLDPGPTAPDLATTLVQVVGPFFGLMERYRATWAEVQGSRAPAHAGDPPLLSAPAAGVHPERMIRAFRLGLKDLLPLWEEILPEETLAQLYPLGLLAADEFRFPATAWAQAVYGFAVAHHERRLPREHLVRALTPLYLGRTAAFLLEAQAAPDRVPALLEEVGLAFEAEKDGLRARWR
jgi:hypothetical protein